MKSTDTVGIKAALAETGGDAFTTYTLTAEDVAGPYVASVPEDYGEKAKLDKMCYTSVTETLAERFHMDENYLKALNPEADFKRVGTIVKVANVGQTVKAKVARIIADKKKKQVLPTTLTTSWSPPIRRPSARPTRRRRPARIRSPASPSILTTPTIRTSTSSRARTTRF